MAVRSTGASVEQTQDLTQAAFVDPVTACGAQVATLRAEHSNCALAFVASSSAMSLGLIAIVLAERNVERRGGIDLSAQACPMLKRPLHRLGGNRKAWCLF